MSDMPEPLRVTGNADADELLQTDFFALLIGMLLDQQFPIEVAFLGPHRLRQRVLEMTPSALAAMTEEEVVAAFVDAPALHRYPAVMAKRAHKLSGHLVAEHDGRVEAIWADGADARTVMRRLKALPGYGPEKSKIFLALLAKRFGVCPDGWEQLSAPFSDDVPRSVADATSPSVLDDIRAHRAELKAAGKDKQGRPAAS